MWNLLHPKTWLAVLDQIDQQSPSYSLTRAAALRRTLVVLATVAISLLFLHYAKFNTSFYVFLDLFGKAFSWPDNFIAQQIAATQWKRLIEQAWWTACHLIAFILFPWLVIRVCFKDQLSHYGWRWQETTQHWRGYLVLLLPILSFVYIASFDKDFVQHYPFYKLASRSWVDLLLWELLYLTQFVFLEFFFRGFVLHALRPALGANAIFVMCVPYMMIHLPKLWPEAAGAIFFGFFLGILALLSRSIWGGVIVHIGIAISMDMMALTRTSGLPTQLFP